MQALNRACTTLHCTTLHCTTLHCSAFHCSAMNRSPFHCKALHNTAPHYTELHQSALYQFKDQGAIKFVQIKKHFHGYTIPNKCHLWAMGCPILDSPCLEFKVEITFCWNLFGLDSALTLLTDFSSIKKKMNPQKKLITQRAKHSAA